MMTGKLQNHEDEASNEPIDCDIDSNEDPDDVQPSTSGATVGAKEDWYEDEAKKSLQSDMQLLSGFYPQCDPEYILKLLDQHEYKEDRVDVVFKELENNEYPK